MTASPFFWAFGLSIAYSLVPGAVTIETLRRGTPGGFRAAVRVRVGALLGSLVWAGIALTGAGLLLRHPPVQALLGVLGAALLLQQAWRAVVAVRAVSDTRTAAPSPRGDVLCGAGFALMNPLVGAFWLGMSGPLGHVAPSSGWLNDGAVFVSGYVLGHLLYTIALSAAVAWGQQRFSAHLLRWANPVGGVSLAYFGLQLLAQTVQLA